MICNVNDDLTRNRPKRTNSLNFNKNNLPTFEKKRRVERLVPPLDFWHVHGVRKYLYWILYIFFFSFVQIYYFLSS